MKHKKSRLAGAVVLLFGLTVWSLTGCTAWHAWFNAQPEAPAVGQEPAPAETAAVTRMKQAPVRDPFWAVQSADMAGMNGRHLKNVAAGGRDPFVKALATEEMPGPPAEPEPAGPGTVDQGMASGVASVRLTTLDRCWLEVFVDDVRLLRTNVPKGETSVFSGREVRLEQVGRDWALVVTLNGRNLGVLPALLPSLEKGPLVYEFDDVRIRLSLGRRYSGGVLVGLKFTVLTD